MDWQIAVLLVQDGLTNGAVYALLGIAIVLVILVVFVFLRSGRATLIPIVAVPVSLIGSFGVMYLAGFSVNNFTLMALTIATGFVVDDAVVVLENTTRHIEAGMAPHAAASRKRVVMSNRLPTQLAL